MDVDTSLKNDNTLSYTVSPSKKDAVDIKGTDTVFDVTDLAVTNPKAVNVRAGQTNGKSVTAELGVDSNSDRQLWAWEIPAPSTKANEQSRITPVVDAEVAPWTIENDNCLPLVPSATTSKPIIADGTEYSTGITVANAEKDYQRLTGTVSIGGKTIKDAKVRVDASGKVYVTLPKGATGAVDKDKPVKVDVELSAQPREATKDSRYEAYNQPQVLRVAQDNGTVTGESPKFSGEVPVAKFAPEYNEPNTVRLGKSTTVAGIMAALCKDGELPEWATKAEGSSSLTGSSKKDKAATTSTAATTTAAPKREAPKSEA